MIRKKEEPVERPDDYDPSNGIQHAVSSPQASSPSPGDPLSAERIASEFSWLNESQEQSHNDVLPQSKGTELSKYETLTDRTRRSMAALFSSDAANSPGSPELPDVEIKRDFRHDAVAVDATKPHDARCSSELGRVWLPQVRWLKRVP